MRKAVWFVGVTLAALTVLAPAAQGGSTPPESSASASRTKDKGCKDRCFHTEATCHRKRRDCMAARQSCVNSCR